MKIKLAVQLSILLAGLVLVVLFRNISESGGFKANINSLFGVDTKNQVNWCPDQAVDFAWTSEKIPEKLKGEDVSSLLSHYCTLKIEAIQGVDIDKILWEKLAESTGPTGTKTFLEWNPEFKVFRSAGMPFKSPRFSGDLLDK